MNRLAAQTSNCGPCLSPKEIKKLQAQEIKDLKHVINFLSKNYDYDKETSFVIGLLTKKLIFLNETVLRR